MSGNIQEALKEAMRAYPQGVTVVTTNHDGVLEGITVSSFTSVSLQPPLILITIAKNSGYHATLMNSDEFAVNFLADDQRSVSDRFAGRIPVKDRFKGLGFSFKSTKAPIIDGVRAFIECKCRRLHDEGDHSIFIGEVVNAGKLNDKNPLVYQNQQYTTTVSPEYPAPPSDIVW